MYTEGGEGSEGLGRNSNRTYGMGTRLLFHEVFKQRSTFSADRVTTNHDEQREEMSCLLYIHIYICICTIRERETESERERERQTRGKKQYR